jgi:hypothetical protein
MPDEQLESYPPDVRATPVSSEIAIAFLKGEMDELTLLAYREIEDEVAY